MRIKFCGAAKQVTGSMHLLELDSGYRVLVDCGLDYEQQREFHFNPSVEFPFEPSSIQAVILTHSHVDHSGNLPTLVKQGFGGLILCTPPTAELTGFLLLDSLKIMEGEERKRQGQKGRKRQSTGSLYGYRDLMATRDRMLTIPFGKVFKLNEELSLEFNEAGHILGAATVTFRVTEGGKQRVLGFTGDLGNYNTKLMKDPRPFQGIDYLITESTYGGRVHEASRNAEDDLLHYIEETCIRQSGRLVIPAFSVGRTQAIIYALHELYVQGRLPDIRYFVDSPLAIRTTDIYARCDEYMNEESQVFLRKYGSLFEFEYLHYINDKKESEALSDYTEPCVIISAAGMVEGGRIQEHVRNNIRNAYSTILIAGFCAEGTLGHRLLSGQGHVNINGKKFPVFASIAKTDAFSAHPDHEGLTRFIGLSGGKDLKGIFLVHGEESSMESLKSDLELNGYKNVIIPDKWEEFELS